LIISTWKPWGTKRLLDKTQLIVSAYARPRSDSRRLQQANGLFAV
jgi:hypothetical protein